MERQTNGKFESMDGVLLLTIAGIESLRMMLWHLAFKAFFLHSQKVLVLWKYLLWVLPSLFGKNIMVHYS